MSLSTEAKKLPTRTQLIERMPKWLFTFILLGFQRIIRSAAGDSSYMFVGPALAAAGAGLVASLTSFRSPRIPVPIPDRIERFMAQYKLSIDSTSAQAYRIWAVLLTFILTMLWALTVKISLNPQALPIEIFYIAIPVDKAQFYLGMFCYIMGVGFSEIKEIL